MKKLFDKLYLESQSSFYKVLEKKLDKKEKMFIVTANPETFNIAENDKDFMNLLLDDETTKIGRAHV